MQEQQIKEKVKERYGKIALTGNSDCLCCAPIELDDNNNKNLNRLSTVSKLLPCSRLLFLLY
jgi:hypothetical protein